MNMNLAAHLAVRFDNVGTTYTKNGVSKKE